MTRSNLEKKIESKIDSELFTKSKRKTLPDGFKGNKVINEVLDKSTIFTLYDLIKSKVISYINGTIKAGKESVVLLPSKYILCLLQISKNEHNIF